jgi:predicted Fe-Mo cluster-binding NifX family protein
MSTQENTAARTVAVPSEAPGGLEAVRSGHFGHCSHFTLVSVEDGQITGVEIVENMPHMEGGCMQPVMLLSGCGASDIIVGGMGARPLMGFNEVGISVYFDAERPLVRDVVNAFVAEELALMSPGMVCGGH